MRDLICSSSISLFGEFLTGFGCFFVVCRIKMSELYSNKDCEQVCKAKNGEVATIDRFQKMDLTDLIDVCPTKEFRVHMDYDWTNRAWLTADGQVAENLMWQSSHFPRQTDIVTVCDLGISVEI